MNSNNVGEDQWQRAETATEKGKQNAQTQYADGMQALSMLYMRQLEALSRQ